MYPRNHQTNRNSLTRRTLAGAGSEMRATSLAIGLIDMHEPAEMGARMQNLYTGKSHIAGGENTPYGLNDRLAVPQLGNLMPRIEGRFNIEKGNNRFQY